MKARMTIEAQTGRVGLIHLADGEGEPMRAVDRIRVIAGVGLEGDRYATRRGHFSPSLGTGRALTLIEAEVIESLRAGAGIVLQPGEARRNLTTRGIRFRIGGVLCEGIRLCEPCSYLEEVVGKQLLRLLAGRGGLRADILEEGEFRVGDGVRAV